MNINTMDNDFYDVCVVLYRNVNNPIDEFDPYGTFASFTNAYNSIINRDNIKIKRSEAIDYFTNAWHVLVEEGLYDPEEVEYRFFMQKLR